MHCFYVCSPVDGVAEMPSEEAKHAVRVLRLRSGEEVCAMDGVGGRWRGTFECLEDGAACVRLLEALPSNEAPARVTLYEGLPKADKLEFIAQKLTELGANALVPVQMARSVVRLDAKDRGKRRERLDRIAREAAKQCCRALPLTVSEALDWPAALKRMAGHDLLLIPWEDARGTRMRDVYSDAPGARDIGIVIGPEGGMSREEVEAMLAIGGRPVTLGPRILRTETAAVAATTMAMQMWGDI